MTKIPLRPLQLLLEEFGGRLEDIPVERWKLMMDRENGTDISLEEAAEIASQTDTVLKSIYTGPFVRLLLGLQ